MLQLFVEKNEFKDNTITIKNLKGVKGQNSQTVPKADLINEVKKTYLKISLDQ